MWGLWAAATLSAIAATVVEVQGSRAFIWAHVLAALAMGFGAVAMGLAAANRYLREGPRKWGIALFGATIVLISGGQAIGYLVTLRDTTFNGAIELVPIIPAAVVGLAALAILVWPKSLRGRDVVGVALDATVGVLATIILWVEVLWASWIDPVSPGQDTVIGGDRILLLIALCAVVVMWTASRRMGSLPLPQLALALGAITVYVVGDVAGEVFPWADAMSSISYSIVVYSLFMALAIAFLNRPPVEPESRTQAEIREAVALLVPLVLALAAGVTVIDLAWRSGLSPVAALASAVAWTAMLGAVLVSRWFAWRDLRDMRERSLNQWIGSRSRRGWFDALLQDSPEFVLVVDPEARVLFASPAANARLPLLDPDTGQSLGAVVTDWTLAELRQLLAEAAADANTTGPFDMMMIQRDGSRCQVEMYITTAHDVEFKGFVLTAVDVTAARRLETELETVRARDRLTGLLTWSGLSDVMTETIASCGEYDRVALVVLDISNFGTWNQSLGRSEGDQILRAVAEAFEVLPPSVAAVARLEADTFAWFIVGPEAAREVSDADQIASRMLSSLILPDDTEVSMFYQAGFSVARARSGITPQRLLEQADVALRRARVSQGSHIVAFRPGMNEDLVRRLAADADLRDAIDGDRLEVLYQPVIVLDSGEVEGVEALVRIRDRDGHLLTPDKFIDLAEELGLIGEIGHRVRTIAVADMLEVQQRTGRALGLAVNVSPREIDSALVADIAGLLKRSSFDPARLTVEITESSLHEQLDLSIGVLQQIRGLGAKVAMDDFGTGYSSLSALVSLPMNVLKIDRSFVRDITESVEGRGLVQTIIRLAGILDLTVVAEGIETPEQWMELKSLKCQLGQGYLFARPMPPASLIEYLTMGSKRSTLA